MVERAHRTDPAAEKPAKEKRGDQNEQAPEEALVECASGECIGDSHQWVDLEEQLNGRGEVQIVAGTRRRSTKICAEKQKEK
jgi:hypothetical protein